MRKSYDFERNFARNSTNEITFPLNHFINSDLLINYYYLLGLNIYTLLIHNHLLINNNNLYYYTFQECNKTINAKITLIYII